MSFLINNLQHYLRVDVIDSLFEQLNQTIASINDFDRLLAAHHTFVEQLLAHTFRTGTPVRRVVGEIFELCDAFCALMRRGGPANEPLGYGELERIEKSFERSTTFLFKLLSSITGKNQLTQLLLRIDFNGHFSSQQLAA